MPRLSRSSPKPIALVLGALTCALLSAGGRARAADAPSAATESAPKAKRKPTKGKSAKAAKKKKAPSSESSEKPALARRRIGAPPAYVVGDSDPHLINDSAPPIDAFPTEGKAVKKAFAETRRDQLVDAEKAARDAKSPDRWRTVLFMLRGLAERTDPEACFWRVLSFYRLGEIPRARTLRENCELPSKDSAVLNGEDITASGVPQMGTVPVDDGFGAPAGATKAKAEVPAAPAEERASAPYTGPGPTKTSAP
ncbi:MAG TPA: hypothetical protein VHL80_05105 [Polyangia bacterium]|nr:hypothetical protein [Polyangia bacterium]